MKQFKIKSVLVLAATTVIAGLCTAQQLPYTGEVTGQDVYVRSEPNAASYPVTKVSAPTKVIVEKKFADGWLAIQPVRGCYGAISQNYVNVAEDGKTGTVTANNVRLRATGKMRQRDFYSVLCKLQKGDKVRIVGRAEDAEGQWHIVRPVGKALFYISAKYVKPVDASAEDAATPAEETETEVTESQEIVEIPQPEKKTETVVVDEKLTVEEKTVIKDVPMAPAEPAEIKIEKTAIAEKPKIRTEADLLKQIGSLEKLLVDECKKPADKRDLDMLKAKADEIEVPASSRFKPVYDSLVDYIDQELALREEARETAALVEQALAESKKTPESKPEEKAKPSTKYDLTGRLEISRLWKYGSDRDRQYILRDPQTRDFLGYVSAANSNVDLGAHLGEIVGVAGSVAYNKTTGGRVLRVASLDILEDTLPQTPRYAEKPKTQPEEKQPEKVLLPDVPVETAPEVAKVPDAPKPVEAKPAEVAPKAPETSQDVLPIPGDEPVAAKPKAKTPDTDSTLLVPEIKRPDIEDIDLPKPDVAKTESDLPLNIEPDNKITSAEDIAPVKKPEMDVPDYKSKETVVKFKSPTKKPETTIAEKPPVEKPVIEPSVAEIPDVEPPAEKPETVVKIEKPEITEPDIKIPEIKAPAEKPDTVAKIEKPEITEPDIKIPEIKAPAEKPDTVAKIEKPEITQPDIKIPEVKAPAEKPESKIDMPELIPPEPSDKVAKSEKSSAKPTITEPVLPTFDEEDDIELKSLDTPTKTMKVAKPESLDIPSPEEKAAPAEVKAPELETPVIAAAPRVETPAAPKLPTRKPRVAKSSVLPGFDQPVKTKATVIEGEYEIEWD